MTDEAIPRTFPAPQSVSPQAQEWLSMQLPASPYPALDDTEGWLQHIKAADEGLSLFIKPDPTMPSVETDIDGVRTYVVRAPEVPDDASTPIYLDIHGGALISGGGEACLAMAAGSARNSGMIHWAVDYRMPPLHPYPAPLDDCMTVYRRLLTERDPADIVVGGGSAGGNLAAALIARAKDEGLPMPAGLVLMTPEVDLTESGDSFTTNLGLDNILSSRLMPANLLYAAGHDLSHPYLSPLFADVRGFPPTFIQAGTRDLFLSNAVRMHRKLRAAGVDAELHVFEAMPHGGFGGAPEDIEMRQEIRRFLDRVRRQRS